MQPLLCAAACEGDYLSVCRAVRPQALLVTLKASSLQRRSLVNVDHLRTVTPLPNFPLAAATGQVRSPALSVFSALRGYPERRGEVPGAQRATAATLQLCSRAAHGLCERVLKLKLKARAPSCRAPHVFRTCGSFPC